MPAKTITLPCGGAVPTLGLGTWRMGEDGTRFTDEVAALEIALSARDMAELDRAFPPPERKKPLEMI